MTHKEVWTVEVLNEDNIAPTPVGRMTFVSEDTCDLYMEQMKKEYPGCSTLCYNSFLVEEDQLPGD